MNISLLTHSTYVSLTREIVVCSVTVSMVRSPDGELLTHHVRRKVKPGNHNINMGLGAVLLGLRLLCQHMIYGNCVVTLRLVNKISRHPTKQLKLSSFSLIYLQFTLGSRPQQKKSNFKIKLILITGGLAVVRWQHLKPPR